MLLPLEMEKDDPYYRCNNDDNGNHINVVIGRNVAIENHATAYSSFDTGH